MSSKSGTGILEILKWAGIAVLVVVPVIVLFKTLSNGEERTEPAEEEDLFSAELEER